MKEVEKGFIQGPIDKDELPLGSTLTKHFPVKQKNKVRPIDDYEASLVNFAVAQTEGVTIHTIDHIASMLAFWMRSGSLSSEDGLVAKCWDFSDAYKQIPLSDEAFHLDSHLAVYDPNCSSAKIFKQCVLPFWVNSFCHSLPSGKWGLPSFTPCGRCILTIFCAWQEGVSRSLSTLVPMPYFLY